MTMDNQSRRDEVSTMDARTEVEEMFLLDELDGKIDELDTDGEDEALLAFLRENRPTIEPSPNFTVAVMQRINQYEEVRSMLGLRWRRLLAVIGSISIVVFILVSPFALTMLAFLDVIISSTMAIMGSLVLDMPSLQWGLIAAAVLLLSWSGWAIRYMAKHSYS